MSNIDKKECFHHGNQSEEREGLLDAGCHHGEKHEGGGCKGKGGCSIESLTKEELLAKKAHWEEKLRLVNKRLNEL